MEDKKINTFFEDYQSLILSVGKLSKSAENPFFKSGYCLLKDVLAEVKRACFKNNFIFIQRPAIRFNEVPEEGVIKNVLITELIHKSGEKVIGEIEIVSKDPTDPQKVGAGITYMRRYSLTTMFGIEEEDDDGNIASSKTINPVVKPATEPNKPFAGNEYSNPTQTAKAGDKCPKCGAEMVLNPRTGKIFCKDKCWTK